MQPLLPQRLQAAKQRYDEALGGKEERLVSGSDDFTMFLWTPGSSKKPVARMTGHQQLINMVGTRYLAWGVFVQWLVEYSCVAGRCMLTTTQRCALVVCTACTACVHRWPPWLRGGIDNLCSADHKQYGVESLLSQARKASSSNEREQVSCAGARGELLTVAYFSRLILLGLVTHLVSGNGAHQG